MTPAFDVYSLGAVVYHCLAGEPPFPERALAPLLAKVTTAERPKISARRPDLPAKMDAWVEQSLAIHVADRFATVGSQYAALNEALS